MTRVYVTCHEDRVSYVCRPQIEERRCAGYVESHGHRFALIERGAPWVAGTTDRVPVEKVHETIEAAQAHVRVLVKKRRAAIARELKRLAKVEANGAKVRRER